MYKLFKPDSPLWPLILLTTAVLYIYHWIGLSDGTRIDDAYMYIRYADNLIAGNGYSWNGDQNTFGCTSISYTLFITAFRWLRPDMDNYRLLVLSAGFWGIASIALLGFTLSRIARTFSLQKGILLTAAVAVFFAFNPGFQLNLISGMDTMMSLFANTLLILASFEAGKRDRPGWYFLAALAAWFTILTRPDNGIFAVLVPGLVFLWVFRLRVSRVLQFYLALAAILAVDTGIKYLLFGNPVPLPYYVKHSDFYAGYIGRRFWNPVDYLTDMLAYAMPFVMGLLVFLKRQWLLPTLALLLPLALTWFYYFSVVQIMGNFSRFYFPGIALLATAAFLSMDYYLSGNGSGKAKSILQQAGKRLHFIAIAGMVWTTLDIKGGTYYLTHVLGRHSVPAEQITQMRNNKVATTASKWSIFDSFSRICAQLPDGTVLAATEHGRIAAENPAIPVIDLTGLHTPEFSRNGFSMDHLRKTRPDLIWMPHYHYVTLNYTIVNDPWFRDTYYFIPGVFRFGIAVRKDREDLFDILLPELETMYSKEDYIHHLPELLQARIAADDMGDSAGR